MYERLDEFGEFTIRNLRDRALDQAHEILKGKSNAPSLQTLIVALSRVSDDTKEAILQLVQESVDCGIHDFLFALQEEYDNEGKIKVAVGDTNPAAVSDGLQGELYSDEGWIKRFSRYD